AGAGKDAGGVQAERGARHASRVDRVGQHARDVPEVVRPSHGGRALPRRRRDDRAAERPSPREQPRPGAFAGRAGVDRLSRPTFCGSASDASRITRAGRADDNPKVHPYVTGMSVIRPVEWTGDGRAIRILDQRELPAREAYRDLRTVDDVCDAISTLAVRGA